MAARYGVRGGLELANAFRQIGAAPTPAARRRARFAAAQVIADAAKENLVSNGSVETGALMKALQTGDDDQRQSRTLAGVASGTFNRQKPSSYSHFVEFGTGPHWQPNRFGGIMHPGARPKPYLRPAYEQNIKLASDAYFMRMREEIEAAAARLAVRARGIRA